MAIFGVGPIGLGHVIMQTHLGREVIAVDVADERLALARELGAHHTFNPKQTENVANALREGR